MHADAQPPVTLVTAFWLLVDAIILCIGVGRGRLFFFLFSLAPLFSFLFQLNFIKLLLGVPLLIINSLDAVQRRQGDMQAS